VDATPLSASLSAALSPAMPPPTIAMRGAVGELFAPARCANASGPTVAAAAPATPARLRKSRRV